jgi:hypothetical protein
LIAVLIAGSRSFSEPRLVTELVDKRIPESSGIAPSRLYPGTYYTLNDSQNPPNLYRFDLAGHVLGEIRLEGAVNFDWEDMATARVNGKNQIYVGDIGDNLEIRSTLTIYRVAESADLTRAPVKGFESFVLTYPDKAHNAETLMVDPRTGEVWIVTKNKELSEIYRATLPAKGGKVALKRIGALTVDTGGKKGKLVTGGAFSADGATVVLRTYSGGLEFDVPKERSNWWKSKPRSLPELDDQTGEAICYSLDGKSLLTSAEGQPCPIHRIEVRP